MTPDTVAEAYTRQLERQLDETAENLSQAIARNYDSSRWPMRLGFGGVSKALQPLLTERMRKCGWRVTYSRFGHLRTSLVIVEPL